MAAMEKDMMVDPRVSKELSRRRVFLFFSVLIIFALSSAIGAESDKMANSFDDAVVVSVALLTLLIIGFGWNKTSLNALKKQHAWTAVIFALALIVQIYAMTLEMNNPADFGNEIPKLVIILLVFANAIF